MSNMIDNAVALDAHIASLSGNEDEVGKIEPTTFETTVHTLHLGDTVTTCAGGATFEHDPDELGLCHFEVSLGPANSKRLIDFLLSLPDEPDEDDEPERIHAVVVPIVPVESITLTVELPARQEPVDSSLPVLEHKVRFDPWEWRAHVSGGGRYDINYSPGGTFAAYFHDDAEQYQLLKDDRDIFAHPTLEDAIELCREHHAKRTAGGSHA